MSSFVAIVIGPPPRGLFVGLSVHLLLLSLGGGDRRDDVRVLAKGGAMIGFVLSLLHPLLALLAGIGSSCLDHDDAPFRTGASCGFFRQDRCNSDRASRTPFQPSVMAPSPSSVL